MERRNVLKTLLMSSLALPLVGVTALEAAEKKESRSGAIRLKYGELAIYIFSDGVNITDEPHPLLAPNQSQEEFDRARKECFLDLLPISFAMNITLIHYQDRYIIFDAGNGLGVSENLGKLYDQLALEGIGLDQITDVIITHGHGDHINGIMLPNGDLAFKNAKYYINKLEYDFWINSNAVELTTQIFKKISPSLTFIKEGDVLFDIIKVEEVFGHTAGNLAFHILQDGQKIALKHMVDVFISPILVRYPAWGIKYDLNFDEAVRERKALLEEAYQKRQLLMTMHLSWPGLGFIDKKDDHYEWIPLTFGSNLDQIVL